MSKIFEFNFDATSGSWGGVPASSGTGFSSFLANKGYSEPESILKVVLELPPEQQIKIDQNLNLRAANPNDPRYPHYRGVLINDANWKQKLIDVFLGKEHNPEIMKELVQVIKRGIHSHQIQSGDQLGGSSEWNKTWIEIYKQWLHKLRSIYEAKSRR
jgi:hypothetical protein